MWMVCCWQLIASNIPALNTRAQMERIASNIAGNIARCGCPFRDIKAEMDKSGDMTAAIRNVLRKRKMEIADFVDTGEESSREESDNEGTDDNNE